MGEQVDKVVAMLMSERLANTISPSLEDLWKVIQTMTDQSPMARQVENLACSLGYGRERLATTLAAVLLAQTLDQQEEILRLSMMQPPPPIHVTVTPERMDQIKKMAQRPRATVHAGGCSEACGEGGADPGSDSDHRGPGC